MTRPAALACLHCWIGRQALGGDRSDALSRGKYARGSIFIVRGRGAAVLAGLLVEGERLAAPRGHRAVNGDPLLPVRGTRFGETVENRLLVGNVDMDEQAADRLGDRKSTRLNSSH